MVFFTEYVCQYPFSVSFTHGESRYPTCLVCRSGMYVHLPWLSCTCFSRKVPASLHVKESACLVLLCSSMAPSITSLLYGSRAPLHESTSMVATELRGHGIPALCVVILMISSTPSYSSRWNVSVAHAVLRHRVPLPQPLTTSPCLDRVCSDEMPPFLAQARTMYSSFPNTRFLKASHPNVTLNKCTSDDMQSPSCPVCVACKPSPCR